MPAKNVRLLAPALVVCALVAPARAQEDVAAEIRARTKQFTQAIVAKDLSILDQVFEPDASNVYWDINEGPLVGFERLKRVWTAATTNFSITRFDFADDMKIEVLGELALQTGTWSQTQLAKDGSSREIVGRATVLWRQREGAWRVFHYHGSITPPRRGPRGPRPPSPSPEPRPPVEPL